MVVTAARIGAIVAFIHMTELYCRECVLEKRILPCGLTRQELKDDKSLYDQQLLRKNQKSRS